MSGSKILNTNLEIKSCLLCPCRADGSVHLHYPDSCNLLGDKGAIHNHEEILPNCPLPVFNKEGKQ